jgi:hypothetical protein
MSILLHGDCLELMKDIENESVDFIFCDLPYGQTACKWDSNIDLELFWKEIMRIKKLNTPIFMTTTTKFGVSLIQSAPKKCPFRWDLVWVKSACAGFLSARKMPMRKHEMVYAFYEKLPFYDLSSHRHKFVKEKGTIDGNKVYETKKVLYRNEAGKYDPPLPVSVVKEETIFHGEIKKEGQIYNGGKPMKVVSDGQGPQYDPPLPTSVVKEKPLKVRDGIEVGKNSYPLSAEYRNRQKGGSYDPPLPTSVVKEERIPAYYMKDGKTIYNGGKAMPIFNKGGTAYDPPLPTSVVKEETGGATGHETIYGKVEIENPKARKNGESRWDPPLPTSVVKEETGGATGKVNKVKENGPCKNYGVERVYYYDENGKKLDGRDGSNTKYDPPLPTSMLEIKSTRGKHSTEKPVALMEYLLKYFSKEGDVVLDPTMGSGSTGVACKNMNRNFIGMEMDPEIYEVAVNRIEI